MIINSYIFKTNSYNIPLDNLVASYRLNGNVLDFKNTHHGTEVGSPTYTAGLFNNALTLNGTDTYVHIPDSDDFTFSNDVVDSPFSISLLTYISSTPVISILVDKSDNTGLYEWRFEMYYDMPELVLFSEGSSSNFIKQRSVESITINTWNHITFTYDGSGLASGIKIYINSVLSTQNNILNGTYVTMNNKSSKVFLGTFGAYPDTYTLDGKLQDVNIWNKELTQSEINDIYNKNMANLYTNQ